MKDAELAEEVAKAKGWPCHMCRYDDTVMFWKCRGCIKATRKSKPSRWQLRES